MKLMYPNFRSDIDMNYKESSLNLQPTQDLMNQAYKVSVMTIGSAFFIQKDLFTHLSCYLVKFKWQKDLPVYFIYQCAARIVFVRLDFPGWRQTC